MLVFHRWVWLRLGCGLTAILLLAVAGWRNRNALIEAQTPPEGDPNVIWSIGKPDGLSDEFATGSVQHLIYEIGKSAQMGWRAQQDSADRDPPVYTVRFSLDRVPTSAPVLRVDCFFGTLAPRAAQANVNGKKGFFRIEPAASQNVDARQWAFYHSRQSLQMPIDPSFLRQGENEIGISFLGGGSAYRRPSGVNYDSLALVRSTKSTADLEATVEPGILFRRSGQELTELTQIVLHHRSPLGPVSVVLEVAGRTITRKDADNGYDFGERVIDLDVPAVSAPAPYELKVTSSRETNQFKGHFRPEKRWRIYAGLKIHNDIGFTDLQPNVQELDNRNTDSVIDIISRFPLYKFNFEDGWLIDNYLESRNASKARRLLNLALCEQVGINAIYLNLLTGLCTGEELYRSLYFSSSLQKKYGVAVKFACLTDAPSHTWFLPSLLADAGIKGFANGSNQARAPILQNSMLNEDSPFYWEGVDGRRMMTWLARGYAQLHAILGDQPSIDQMRRALLQFLARYRRDDYPVDAVLLYGLYSDNVEIGNGAAEAIEEWNQLYEFPKIIPATDADYYAYLSRHFADKLPTYRGDAGAYWEDGAASTAAETILSRDTQRLLPVAEMAAAVATLFEPEQTYPASEFRDAWKNLLFYDEHTWGANTSIRQPDRQFSKEQWEFKRAYAHRAHRAASDLLVRSFNRLVQNISIDGPTLFVFNPLPWPRTDVVEIELESNRQVADSVSGKPASLDVVSEKEGYRVLRLVAGDLPALGYRTYSVRALDDPVLRAKQPRSEGWEAETRHYRLVFDPKTGAISELYDKDLARDLVDRDAPYKLNELLYVAGGDNSRILHDMVNLKPAELEVHGQRGAQLIENVVTPLGRRLRIRAQAKNVPAIETEVTLYHNLKRVDIVNHLRKDEVRTKEAVYFAFPFRASPPEMAYQIQNTWVRPNIDQLPGACREWFATQNVAVVRDPAAVIAWATPDAPLITLTDINRGLWLKHLDIKNGHIFSYVMNNYWFTNYKASQGGDFTFRYFITSGRKLGEADLARFSAETRSPLVAYNYYQNIRRQAARKRMPLGEGSFLKIDASHVEIAAFKEAEDYDGYILRLRETAGRKGATRLESPVFPLRAAFLTTGVEENVSSLAVTDQGIEVPLNPWKFSTVRLIFAPLGGRR